MVIKSPQLPMSVFVLAGGRGNRLWPFTENACRSKPMVPFGKYKLIDFAVNNAVNSGADHIYVLPQYYQNDISRYFRQFNYNAPMYGKTFDVFGPEHVDNDAYSGTANAIYQNLRWLKEDSSEVVAILAADHIYKIDLKQVLDYHLAQKSHFTICGYEVDREEAKDYGVLEVDENNKIIAFQEKSNNPATIPNKPNRSLASMGIYLVDKQILIDELEKDHADHQSTHDFGHDIITRLIEVENRPLYYYPYSENRIPGEEDTVQEWRDVGNPLALFEANMDVVGGMPIINLFNNDAWPLRTRYDGLGSFKITFNKNEIESWKREFPNESFFPKIAGAGECIFTAPRRLDYINVSRQVHTEFGVDLREVVLLYHCHIDHHVQLYRTFVEENVYVPPYARVGFDIEEDIRNGILLGIDKDLIENGQYKEMDPKKIIRIITKDHKLR